MLIILNSLISLKTGKVPITFVLQCAFWLWKEVIDQLFSDHAQSGVSNIAHLSGAICGTWFGYRLHGEKVRERTKKVAGVWMGRIAGKKNK
jgi:membrane associated rhomboid family serine protease